jgi:tryptophan-rich sensory protein
LVISALVICAGMAVLERVCAGPNPMAQLRVLRQPRASPPLFVWVLIGVFWYAICFTALVRLLPIYDGHSASVWLLIALMAANAAANVPQFRLHRLDIAFLYLFPYWVLLGAFIWSIRHLDPVTLLLFGIYSAYQPYAAAWSWGLWQMNKAVR